MKRKRKSIAYPTKVGNKDEHIEQMGPVITDLPKFICQIILLKLPTRSILICKCVCKTWRVLISDPEFAKMHFAQAEAYPMVRPWGPTRVSRTLYLVEPEDEFSLAIKDKDYLSDCDYGSLKFDKCHFRMNLAKYKLPLRDAEKVMNNDDNVNLMRNRKHGSKRMPCIKIRPNDHKYNVVNSCNGFLCLSEPIFNDPVVVCNPVTGEFMHLPEASKRENQKVTIHCGIGFSPKANRYKVVRIFDQGSPHPITMAEAHTLGSSSWKLIGSCPCSSYNQLAFPTYIEGALYWFYYDPLKYVILSFDLDSENFQSLPPLPFQREQYRNVSMGVLGNCLCVCDAHGIHINLWVLKNHGAKRSWRRKISIETDHFGFDGERWPSGLYKPMKYCKDGGLLMFNYRTNALIYHHPKTHRFIYLKLRGIKSNFSAISHVPSFISLKDILVGDDVNILNINSRCAQMKLLGETRALFLEEEIADLASDFFTSDSSDED
ncbi:putative F-box domain-containing protein [Rosa chinensis]|uniref:Putative F-box domain-containing protein n=1 Tax=Rosa chinensis TaxID=74649 RepID=A0A2P6RV00_ROSCH|nr:F-box protein At3g07870 [Rosa chinensis]PRQ50249.1 putative F-box domain-containing protein [Rosa chinensis]